MHSSAAMSDFIAQVVESSGGHVESESSLKGFAPFHSGELGEQTYERLVNELRGFRWTGLQADAQSPQFSAPAGQPAAGQPVTVPTGDLSTVGAGPSSLDQAGYKKVVNMHSSAAMSDFIARVVESLGGHVESESSLKGFAPFHSGVLGEQTYERLVKELHNFKWTGVGDPNTADGQNGPPGQQSDPASATAAASSISAADADLAPATALVPASQQPPPAAAAAVVQPIDIMEGKTATATSAPQFEAASGKASAPPSISKPPTIFAEVGSVESSVSGMSPSQVVQTATLDEAGYQRVAQLGSSDAMLAYMKRVARNGGGLMLEPKELASLAPLHSGEKMVQGYDALCRDLRLKSAAARGLAMMETSAAVEPRARADDYVP